jgi:NTE family protein
MTKEITIALGGGGVKGNAHIGVLRALEGEGYHIRAVAGTSAGGMVGSLYAFGYTPDEILRRFHSTRPATLYERQPEDGPAWLGLKGVHEAFLDALGDSTFEDLRIPFAVTAVDIHCAEYVVLRSGNVVEAVMATIAVPGMFPPRELDGRTLVDGGVMDPVPAALARSLAPGLPVVAVSLTPKLEPWDGYQDPGLLATLPFGARYFSRLRVVQALNTAMRSIDIAGALLSDLLLKVQKPDVIIRPALTQVGLLDEVDVDEFVRLGEQAVKNALPDLQRAVGWPARLRRWLKRTSQ